MLSMMTSITGLTGGRMTCPRCGGPVRDVQDGHELPGEFRLTPRKLLLALVLCALSLGFISFIVGFSFLATDVSSQMDQQAARAVLSAAQPLMIKLAVVGSVTGILLSLVTVLFSFGRHDMDEPIPNSRIPFGQAATLMPVLLIGCVMGLSIAVWLIPVLATGTLPLRSTLIRAGIGVVWGLFCAPLSHGILFMVCRSRLPRSLWNSTRGFEYLRPF